MTTHCSECGWYSAGPHVVHELDCSQFDLEEFEAQRNVGGINCCRPVSPDEEARIRSGYFTVFEFDSGTGRYKRLEPASAA